MRKLLLLSALLVSATAPTYADTLFNLNNATFSNGAVATGTIAIDTTAGVFDAVNVSVVSGSTTYVFSGVPTAQMSFDNNTQYFEQSFDAAGNELVIDIPGGSLMGYAGGALCSTSNLCDGLASAYAMRTGPATANAFALTTGSLAAATPEPSSMVLLGTGVLSALGMARRRFTRMS